MGDQTIYTGTTSYLKKLVINMKRFVSKTKYLNRLVYDQEQNNQDQEDSMVETQNPHKKEHIEEY